MDRKTAPGSVLPGVQQIVGTLRAAGSADAMAIADLVNRAYRPEAGEAGWTHESGLVSGLRTSPDQVEAALARPQSVILVVAGTAGIVACVHVEKSGVAASIGMLAVAPARQGQGLGDRMLAEAERHAVRMFGVAKLTMTVVAPRAELLAFYERRGYRKTGVVAAYPAAQGVGTPLTPGLTIETLEKPARPGGGT